MKRDAYYSYISEKIEILCLKIKSNGKLNILNLNIHAEFFYRDLCSLIFGLNLENANIDNQNAAAIDLIDKTKKIIIQVSSTNTKKKIDDTLSKKKLLEYKEAGYRLKFLFFSSVSSSFKKNNFKNVYGINFSPTEDIIDKDTILRNVLEAKIDKQKNIYEFVKAELGEKPDITKISSNLADLINLLSEEDLGSVPEVNNLHEYNIDNKIDFNNLEYSEITIAQYKIFYPKLDGIYKAFDIQGKNKSLSVFNKLTRFYTDKLMKLL